jgi:CBS domain-containing protein
MTILARDVMATEVISVAPTLPLAKLEDELTARHISGAPVVDNGKLVGIVSRADIVRYFSLQRAMVDLLAVEHSKSAGTGPGPTHEQMERKILVRDIMARNPVVVSPDAPVEEVAKLMLARHVHRLLVTEGGQVVGVISSLDLVKLIVDGRMHSF